MEIYNCKVHVGGSRDNEVRRLNVPAAEIVMLRHLHGEDHVVDLVHVGTSDISDKDVRDLLAMAYGPGDVDMTRAGPAILREVFGPAGNRLPQEIEDVEKAPTKTTVRAEKIKRLRDVRPEDDIQALKVDSKGAAVAMFED